MSPAYYLTGLVIHGDNRGRSLGIPTANLQVADGSILPPPGIYACLAHLASGREYVSTLHLGPRPTFPGSAPSIEVHLIDYPDRDLYRECITCTNLRYLRRIEKFVTTEDLVNAMTTDIYAALKLFKHLNAKANRSDS